MKLFKLVSVLSGVFLTKFGHKLLLSLNSAYSDHYVKELEKNKLLGCSALCIKILQT